VTPAAVAELERALAETRSEKEQRNHIKRLLFNSGARRGCSGTPHSLHVLSE
jgi:hypothetical protein